MENELILTQAECYRLSKANGEMQRFIQQLMQKAGVATPQELMEAIPEGVKEGSTDA